MNNVVVAQGKRWKEKKKRENTFKYVFCVHICVLHERVLKLCNVCTKIYTGRVCMCRLLMEEKGPAKKLLGNGRKFMS